MLHRYPTNWLFTSCLFCLLKSIWPTWSPLNLNHNQGADDKQRNCTYVCICQGTPLLAALITIVQNSWQWHATKLAQAGLSAPYCLSHSQRTPSFGNKIGMCRKMVRNLFPNDQFGNNMFHSQRGTQKKTLLNYEFGNNMFHLQIGTRNKTVLNVQLWNKLFHLQIGTRNKTVLNDQFGNILFHLQRGPRNKAVLIYQFRNNVFDAQIGTRHKTVLIYQFKNNMFHL